MDHEIFTKEDKVFFKLDVDLIKNNFKTKMKINPKNLN